MLYTCYLRNGIVYVPTVGNGRGVYTLIEPVAVVPVANTEGLRIAFREVVGRKNVDVPPVKGKCPPPSGQSMPASKHQQRLIAVRRPGISKRMTINTKLSVIDGIQTDIGLKIGLKRSNFLLELQSRL
jgi:hypothetical protein